MSYFDFSSEFWFRSSNAIIFQVWFAACAESLTLCPNLLSFTCTSDVPPFLPLLPTKERLTELKLHAAFSTEQAGTLIRLRGLRSLTLYQASWNVCHALQAWIPRLASTLTHLTIMVRLRV